MRVLINVSLGSSCDRAEGRCAKDGKILAWGEPILQALGFFGCLLLSFGVFAGLEEAGLLLEGFLM